MDKNCAFWWKAPEVFLASTSVQRMQVLKELQIPFRLLKTDVEEVVCDTPQKTVQKNAKKKVSAGLLESQDHDTVVIGADTVLALNGNIYGKPLDAKDAKRYLEKFSGNRVMAYSGIAAARKGERYGLLTMESAEIEFFPLSSEMIDWYVTTGEPLTRAGAFGINKTGEILTRSIAGCYSCVAGLPKRALLAVLQNLLLPENMPDFVAQFKTIPITLELFEVAAITHPHGG